MLERSTDTSFNQWFAGLIDGHGYLAVQSNNNVAVLEISTHKYDQLMLQTIIDVLGSGSSS
jgi:hypothetical protein